MASTLVVSIGMALAITFTLVGVVSFVRGIISLFTIIGGGASEPGRASDPTRRLWVALVDILTHRTFRGRPVVRIAHWLVMVSFVVLILTLVRSYVQVRDPEWNLPLLGGWAPWNWLVEFFAWAGLLGIIALMVVRATAKAKNRDSRLFGSTTWQAYFVEWVILLVCACVIVLHGLECALTNAGPMDFPFTFWLGALLAGLPTATLLNLVVIASTIKIAVSMSWMTLVGVQTAMGVSWHRFLAPINMFTSRNADGSKSLGALIPVLGDIDSEDEEVTLGLGTTADLTWKDRLDVYSCTECGRCQAVCPAWNTGKPLSPKLLTLALRDNVASASQVQLTTDDSDVDEGDVATSIQFDSSVSPHTSSFDVLGALRQAGIDSSPIGEAPLVPDVLGPDMIWDCTMCGACVEQCPVDIEHVDHIANLRRFQVLMESAFPRDLARPFKGMETKGNPYGQIPRKRLDWAKNLEFPVPVIGQDVQDATDVDYLFWVGCAGAYDDRQKKTTAAVAELLHTAGVSFAVLGAAESCTGDPARRAGNEVLFQMLAEAAIETLTEVKAQRIVVTCAHCFNTIANEFPQLNGHFEVIHHTQLLNRLLRENLLTPVGAPDANKQSITYHDPCFLGRHNRVFEAPRELLGSIPGLQLTEMPRNQENAFCCGAGGARAWTEETRGTRIATNRMEEAAATGAHTLATACPFCTQMLDSAAGSITGAPAPEVKDVALLLLDGVRRGQPESHPHQ